MSSEVAHAGNCDATTEERTRPDAEQGAVVGEQHPA